MSELDQLKAAPDDAKALLVAYAQENARLHRRIQEVIKENAELKGGNASEQLAMELSSLQEQMVALQREMFGDSSERRPDNKPPR